MHILSSFGRAYDSPTLLGSCASWHDASDSGDAGKMTVSTGDVTAWIDQTTNSRDFANTGNYPSVNASGLNSLDTIVFDGSEYLHILDAWLYAANGATLYAVIKAGTGIARFDRIYNEGSSSGGQADYSLLAGANAGPPYDDNLVKIRTDAGSNRINTDLGQTHWDDTWNIYAITDSGTSITPHIDGVSTTTQAYTRSGTLTLGRTALGCDARTLGNNATPIEIAELTTFTEAHDALQRNLEIGRLAHKWGLTGNLAAGHPFKTFPPSLH